MSIKNTRKRQIKPVHPGEMLREDFLPDYGLTPAELAAAIGVSIRTVREILKERRSVTPATALRLSRLFGNSPEFWLKAQHSVDLWEAENSMKTSLTHIRHLKPVIRDTSDRMREATV